MRQLPAGDKTITSQASSKGGAVNYGERLYNRGVQQREEKEMMIRQVQSEKLRDEVEGLTFQPQINKNFKASQIERGIPTEELLINYGKRRDEVLNF